MHHLCYSTALKNNNEKGQTFLQNNNSQAAINHDVGAAIEMAPLYCQTLYDEKKNNNTDSHSSSPELFTISSSSSSNDQGLGDEIPDDSDGFESSLNELEAAINKRFSFYENIVNMDCSLNISSLNENKDVKLRQNIFPTGKPPIYTPLKKTRIPKLTLMSSSLNSEGNTISDFKTRPDANNISCRIASSGHSIDLSQSYHGNTNASRSWQLPRFSLTTPQGSAEQLAERILTPKEECQQLLRRCKEDWRRPIIPTTPYFPERSVIMPIKRHVPIPSAALSPFPHDNDLPPQQEISKTIQNCLSKIMKAGETLKNIEDDVLLPTRQFTKLKEKPKLERNPDADKYKNPFGGRIQPVERQLALFRNARTQCICCRFVSVLHRLHQRIHLRRQRRVTVRITKRYVVIRDRCHCFSNKDKDFDISLTPSSSSHSKSPLFVNEPPFAYIIWLAALSCIIRVLLFIFYHE